MLDEQMGQGAVVHISARDDTGRRDALIFIPPIDNQGCPSGDRVAVLAVFHAMVAMVCHHLFVPCTEESDIGVAPNEAHMWTGMDEIARVGDRALLDQE